MAATMTFGERLAQVLAPSSVQALIAIIIAVVLVAFNNASAVISRLGITTAAIDDTIEQIHSNFGWIITSPIVSNAVLMAFWATVGLITYLICWGFYNFLIEARNEVTLTTAYTNHGALDLVGPWKVIAIKAVSAAGLVASLVGIKLGMVRLLQLSTTWQNVLDPLSIGYVIIAIIGSAVIFYVLFMFIELTITPWYSKKLFTE